MNIPLEHYERKLVCEIARSWLRTPYRDGAMVKGSGVDCAQLAQAVYQEAGVIPVIELPKYSPQWHVNRGGQRFMEIVLERGGREVESPSLGDLVLYKFGRSFAHGAIVVDPGWPQIIEACKAAGIVQLADGSKNPFEGVERKFFTLW